MNKINIWCHGIILGLLLLCGIVDIPLKDVLRHNWLIFYFVVDSIIELGVSIREELNGKSN
jgi:hypothetical protein